MKSRTKTRGLLLFLIVISLAVTGSGVFADEFNPVYSGTPPLAVNVALVPPDYGPPSASLSILSQYMTSPDDMLSNENSKGVVRNFSNIRTFVPTKSSLVTKVMDSPVFNMLEKSYQEHPPSRYYFDSSPLYCSGGY
jgi:hypothetical protein